MSFESPAKQERVERHLMRQRGAGIRTVSTNFGFAFGLQSEETSRNATPTPGIDGPLAKRRKTIVSNGSIIPEAALLKSTKAPSVKRANKARRKFPLEDDDVRLQTGPVAEDDSFVAVLGNKKTLNKKSKTQTKKGIDGEVGEGQKKTTKSIDDPVATVTRLRRVAAAAAASKVAEGFEEEQTSMDKERQDPKPTKRTRKSRQKSVVAQPTAQSKTTSDEHLKDIATTAAKARPKKRVTTKKGKIPSKESVIESEIGQAVNTEIDELAANIAGSTQDSNTKYRQQLDLSEVVPKMAGKSKSKKPSVEKRKRQSSIHAVEPIQAPTEHFFDALTTVAERQVTFEPGRQRGKPGQRRQPLTEADINITLRPSSLEKIMQASPKEAKPLPKKTSKPRTKILEYPASPRPKTAPSRKRKLNINHDAIEIENQNAGAESSGEHLKGLSSTPHFADSKEAEQSSLDRAAIYEPRAADYRQGAAKAVLRRGNLIDDQANAKRSHSTQPFAELETPATKAPSGKSRARPISCQSGTSTSAHPDGPSVDKTASKCADEIAEIRGEEDVDWLFAPQSQAIVPKRSGGKPKSGSVSSKSKNFKMPEMDLDELLSNIASFAQDESMPGAKNLALFAGGQQKQRRGSRKKAKS